MTFKIGGGCACGAVRYEIAADPQFQCQCQCRACQRTTGAGHSDVLGVSENASPNCRSLKSWGRATKQRWTRPPFKLLINCAAKSYAIAGLANAPL